MIVCVLLMSNSRGCCLAAPGDHDGATLKQDTMLSIQCIAIQQSHLLMNLQELYNHAVWNTIT